MYRCHARDSHGCSKICCTSSRKHICLLSLRGFFWKIFRNFRIWPVLLSSSYQHCTSPQVDETPPCLTLFLLSFTFFLPSFLWNCQSVRHTQKSLCVVFGRAQFSATICLLLLSLSVSLSLRLSHSPDVAAKATHRRSFFLLLLLKSWKPCEVVWLSADRRALWVASTCSWWCVSVVMEEWLMQGRDNIIFQN